MSALAVDNFAEGVGAVYGLSGDRARSSSPSPVHHDVLLEEVQQSTNDTVFMAMPSWYLTGKQVGWSGLNYKYRTRVRS